MNVLGIIAEFNPFHNGHAYLIEKARKEYQADYCIVVMSGDFVQRGEPAIFPKELRTTIALQNGADLVLELPVSISTGSAEYFAQGSVALLERLGVVTHLCFGSENGDITLFQKAGQVMQQESDTYKKELEVLLKSGCSFPAARFQALSVLGCTEKNKDYQAILPLLQNPNNILGVEYCRALTAQNSSITACTITRKGAGYHDSIDSSQPFASASGIRKTILHNAAFPISGICEIAPFIPENCHELYQNALSEGDYVTADDFFSLLQYKILQSSPEILKTYQDVTSDLAEKIWNLRYQVKGFTDYCEKCKSKNYTYTRISRALLHILLEIEAEDVITQKEQGFVPYARILGFQKASGSLLSEIKKHSSIPLVSKLSDAKNILSETTLFQLEQTIHASDLYRIVQIQKGQKEKPCEYARPIIIL